MVKPNRLVDPTKMFMETDVPWEVVTPERLHWVMKKAGRQKVLVYDLETTGTKVHKGAFIVSFILAWGNKAYYFPLRHAWPNTQDVELPERVGWTEEPEETDFENLDEDLVIELLRPILENDKILKLGSWIQFDYRTTLATWGIVTQRMMDIGSAARLCRSYDRVGLKDLMISELHRYPHEQDEMRAFMKEIRLKFPIDNDRLPISVFGPYTAADGLYPLKIARRMIPEITEHEGSRALLKLESKLIPVLGNMELRGIPVNVPYLEALGNQLDIRKQKLKKKAHKAVGFPINPGSPPQVKAFLFGPKDQREKVGPIEVIGGLGLKPLKTTQGGVSGERQPSLDEEDLAKFHDVHDIVPIVQDYRSITKILSAYIRGKKGILQNQDNGIVFPDLIVDAARSGRMSAREPSLNNIPKEDDLIRRAFVPNAPGESGWHFLLPDLSQVEIRIFVHYLDEPDVVQAIKDGLDFHAFTASMIFNIPVEKIISDHKDLRQIAKTINFAVIYGAGIAQVARNIEINGKPATYQQAKEFLERYHRRMPFVKRLQDRVGNIIAKSGIVTTYFGRRRRYPVSFGYAALNHIIQGSAAEVLKYALLRADEFLADKKTKVLMTIHDELFCRYHESEDLFHIIAGLNDAMTDFNFRVPLVADVSMASKNWAETEDIDVRERWLQPDWDEAREWRDEEAARLHCEPKEIAKSLKRQAPGLVRRVMDVNNRIKDTLTYRSNLLGWKDNLGDFKSVWRETFQTYSLN